MKTFLVLVGVMLCDLLSFAVACPVPPQSVPSARAKALAVYKLEAFQKCDSADPVNDKNPCNTFAAHGLETLYGVNDFKTGAGYLSANDIADFVAGNGQWAELGAVLDEDNNLCAQALANQGYPVIAVMKAAKHGHIALIIPGEPAKSPSWGMLAANSASFFYEKLPLAGYVSKPLSAAFQAGDAKNAHFYYRKITALPRS